MPKKQAPPTIDNKSTKAHRNTMRATGMTEILNSSIATFSFPVQIPIKFSQSLLLGFSLFSQNLKTHEQLIQLSQLLLSSIQTAILIGLFLGGKEIVLASTLIMRVFTLCDMLNKGILLTGWAPSELSKEELIDQPIKN